MYVYNIDTIKSRVKLIPFINIAVTQTYILPLVIPKWPRRAHTKSSVKPRDYAYLKIRKPSLVQALSLLALPLE